MEKMTHAEAIYFGALDIRDPDQRRAYLDEACGQDDSLRRRIERLLATQEQLGQFLEQPAIRVLEIVPVDTPHDRADDSATASTPASTSVQPVNPEARYQLSDEIGRGGMGRVLLGRDTDLKRDVAVKVLLENHQGRTELMDRFIAEARIASQLQHPGIVPVYEMGRFADDRPYFTMKLVQGQTLAGLLAERAHPAQDQTQFLRIFLQVCQALAYAHSRQVIHRDLKPANIMVGEFGEVQVMDWGLAKVLSDATIPLTDDGQLIESGDVHTQTGIIVGTPAYLAPEQARHETQRNDPRVDVFGLGGILCEILTGQPPFRGANAHDMLTQAKESDLSDAYSRLRQCSEDRELAELARECLAIVPQDRPSNAGVVAERVAGYLANVQERLRNAALGQAKAETRAEGERRRRWLVLALATALVFVLLGGGSAAWLVQQQKQRQREITAKTQEALQRGRTLLDDGWKAHDLDKLKAAAVEFEQAHELARSAAVSAEVQEESAALLAQANERLQRAERNRTFLDELLDTATPTEQQPDADMPQSPRPAFLNESDQRLGVLFRRWGLDLETLAHEKALERLRDEPAPVREEIIASLDLWTAIRRRLDNPARWRSLYRLVNELDGDEVRRQLRSRVYESPLEQPESIVRMLAGMPSWAALWSCTSGLTATKLGQLRQQFQPKNQPVLTVLLLAEAAADAGHLVAAEQVLRQAIITRPDDVRLLNLLGQVTEAQGPDKRSEAIGYYRAARALRPSLGRGLSLALNRSPKIEEREEAELLLRELIRQYPQDAKLHVNLSHVLYGLDRFADMAKAAAEAIRLEPTLAEAHNNRGLAMHRQQQLAEAVKSYQEAIRLRPSWAMAHSNLGLAYADQNKLPDAIAAHQEAVRLDPDRASFHNNLGVAYFKHGQYSDAVTVLERAILLEPLDPDPHHNLGEVLQVQMKFSEAEAQYRQAIRLSHMPLAYSNLILVLHAQNKLDDAITVCREASQFHPNAATPHYNLGFVLEDQNRLPEAIAAYREALRLQPNYPSAWNNLAAIYLKQNQLTAASEAIQEALRYDPDHANAYMNLAKIRRAEGKLDDSANALRQAIRCNPREAQFHMGLAGVLRQQNKLAETTTVLQEVIRLQPNDPLARYRLGTILMDLNKQAEASAAFQEAIRLNPNDADAHCRLAETYRRQGKFREALNPLRRGHELGMRTPNWSVPTASLIKQVEREIELDQQLPAILKGERQPKDANERIELARICAFKGLHASTVQFYADAFNAEPKLTDPLKTPHRRLAAIAAIQAAQVTSAQQEQARLRAQALTWLQAELTELREAIKQSNPNLKASIVRVLSTWLTLPELASVREHDALAKLPEVERTAWQQFWAALNALRSE